MSDLKGLETKMEARFDRLEAKLDGYAAKTIRHSEQIKGLQGHAKTGLALMLGVLAYLAKAFFGAHQ